MSSADILKISPSSLSLYLECARCFWLLYNKGIRRPATPFSTLPSGVDYTLKVYFDHWREGDGTPPMLKNKLPGRLLSDKALISRFRSRSFGYFDKEANAYFNGMLDDALELPDGFIVPLDNKTKGFPPGEPHFAHINQMSAYTLFLKENGIKTKNIAYLVYWYFDHKHMDVEKPMEFNVLVEEVKTEPDSAKENFRRAVKALQESEPPVGASCGFCHYRNLGI